MYVNHTKISELFCILTTDMKTALISHRKFNFEAPMMNEHEPHDHYFVTHYPIVACLYYKKLILFSW